MPFEVIETTDPIAEIIDFRSSAVYEMIISLQSVIRPGRHAAWAETTRQALPTSFIQELHAMYEPYKQGMFFFELAVDYHDHADVPGFVEYVRTMDPVDFVFYLVGRVLPREQIAEIGMDYDGLMDAMAESPYGSYCACQEVPFDAVVENIHGFQNRLADLWESYWELFFRDQIDDLRPHWEKGITEKSALLARQGGQALWENVTGKPHLMDPLPPGMPFTEIVFIPLYLIPGPVFMHFGYGNITVMFDSERTESRVAEIERNKEETLNVLKALGDSSRLEILRLVAQYESKIHGKKIAAHLNLSPSAVSRHLNQLKDAGLILEDSQDNRTITYRLQSNVIQSLPERLWEVLHH